MHARRYEGAKRPLALLLERAAVLMLLTLLTGCAAERAGPEVEIRSERPISEQGDGGSSSARIESDAEGITIRQVFEALGPCRELMGDVVAAPFGRYAVRITARGPTVPCDHDLRHIRYSAVVKGLPAGYQQLRIVHVEEASVRVVDEMVTVKGGPER